MLRGKVSFDTSSQGCGYLCRAESDQGHQDGLECKRFGKGVARPTPPHRPQQHCLYIPRAQGKGGNNQFVIKTLARRKRGGGRGNEKSRGKASVHGSGEVGIVGREAARGNMRAARSGAINHSQHEMSRLVHRVLARSEEEKGGKVPYFAPPWASSSAWGPWTIGQEEKKKKVRGATSRYLPCLDLTPIPLDETGQGTPERHVCLGRALVLLLHMQRRSHMEINQETHLQRSARSMSCHDPDLTWPVLLSPSIRYRRAHSTPLNRVGAELTNPAASRFGKVDEHAMRVSLEDQMSNTAL